MEFLEHLKTYLSDEEIDKLSQALQEENLHGVLLNPNKMSDEKFLELFPNIKKHPIVPHAYIYLKEIYNLGKSIYHTLGCFYLQEPSAMVPAYLLNAKENELVLDMCAAPGGKTIQTSFLMRNTGLIISNDLSRSRASAIVENEERLGLGNIVVANNDLSKIYKNYLNTFDKIILDAPCSGSGMFRKDSKMIDDWSYNKVLKFAETQKELISIAYTMLKPGGTICYSTCSFSYEEDENVIDFLCQTTDCEVVNLQNDLFYISKKKPLGVHLLPNLFPGEGHYICLIKKPGNYVFNAGKDGVKEIIKDIKFKQIRNFANFLFGLDYEFNFRHFNIVRFGVKIGEMIKGTKDIKFDYHYAHYVKDFPNIYEINIDELKKYLTGNTINNHGEKGYYLLTYNGINVDISKGDGKIFKNHLPKHYRASKNRLIFLSSFCSKMKKQALPVYFFVVFVLKRVF